MRYSWSPETSSTCGLVFYSVLYSGFAVFGYLIWFIMAHPSLSLPVRILLSLFLGNLTGGPLGIIAWLCIAELVKRYNEKAPNRRDPTPTLLARPNRSLERPLNSREQGVRTARELISDDRLTAFFRAIRGGDDILAVKLINEHLDRGERMDALFYTSDEYGYLLSVVQKSDSILDISFGCQAGPLAGDGGNWQVSFRGNVVLSVNGGTSWIS